MREILTRAFELDDISVSRSGTGRTVTAYAAVFNRSAPVRDFQGQYNEQYVPTAFNKTIADRGVNRGVFYNHALTVHGTPAEGFSIPLGVCRSINADPFGVLTVSEYSKGAFQDQILDGIESGAIRAQSFSGPIIASTPDVPRGGFRPAKDGALSMVTRMEMGLNEYGPAAMAVFADAAILSVRSMVERMTGLSTAEKDELFDLLRDTTPGEPVARSDTPDGAVAEEPHADGEHSVREYTPAQRRTLIRARILARSQT